jgi:restriction system protein
VVISSARPGTSRPEPWLEKPTQGKAETMELTDYPLLHEADLMLTLLKVAAQGPASVEDAIERLKQNLRTVGESPPVSDEEFQQHLSRVREHLVQAVLLAPLDDGRLTITPRGMQGIPTASTTASS